MEIKNNIYNLVFILFLCVGVLSSCIRDPHPGYDMTYAGSQAEVMLTVGIGSGSGEAGDIKEGIKQMRVIVASVKGADERLLHNEVFDDAVNTNAKSYTVNLIGLPKGQTKFYIVCNEGSLPQSVQDYLSGLTEGANLSGFSEYVVNDDGRQSFPRLRIDVSDNVGLPITGISPVVDLQKKIESISFNIKYMVAKVVVDVTNNTKLQLSVNNFKMSSFFSDKAYLFPQDGGVKIPANTRYVSRSFNINGTSVRSGEKLEGAMNLYVYPSGAGQGNYTISMNDYEYIPFFSDPVLDRGVRAELNGIFGDNPIPEFEYKVRDWEIVNNDVPVFD